MNYDNSLFSLDREAPSFLPARIRLVNGLTRTPESVTLEELSELNYTGPYTVPSYNTNTQYLTWDSNTLSFVVNDIIPGQPTVLEDQRARADLHEQLVAASKLDDYEVTLEYSAYIEEFKHTINRLLSTPTLLDSSVVPPFTPPYPSTMAEMTQYLNKNFYTNSRSKDLYESFGYVPEIPKYAQKYFQVPSGWVYDPMPDVDFIFYVNELTSLATLSGVAPPVSGCFPTRNGNLELLIATDFIFP